MKYQLILIAITAVLIPLSFVQAPYPEQLLLQHILTVIGIILLAVATVGPKLSNLSFACLIGFLWLHIIGARWIYSFVPYDDFAQMISGVTISETFGWQRNHYDRLVHFASGLLWVAPGSELLQRACGMRPLAAVLLAISLVLSIGAIYEILEWQIATMLSPAQAAAYNGQQGDVWDPQKDMAFAGLGAVISAGALFRWIPSETAQSTNYLIQSTPNSNTLR